MAVSFDKVNAGDTLWDCRYTKAGNTTMKRWSCWTLYVVSVNREERSAVIRWNGNGERTVYANYFAASAIKRKEAPDPRKAREAKRTAEQRSTGGGT